MNNSLDRFLVAQQQYFYIALEEIQQGRKQSHWMWYIFPQIQGLGMSAISQEYAIKDLQEAKEYLADFTLRNNLIEISDALLQNESNDAREIMGFPDDMKLRSSMTLFALADDKYEVFKKVLDKFFDGKMDDKTIQILNSL